MDVSRRYLLKAAAGLAAAVVVGPVVPKRKPWSLEATFELRSCAPDDLLGGDLVRVAEDAFVWLPYIPLYTTDRI